IGEALGDAGFVAPFELRRAGAVGLEALPAEDQLQPPAAAAELPVGGGAQAYALLQRDHLAHAFILDLAQVGVVVRPVVAGGRLRPEELLARLLQLLGGQKAADMVGPKRWSHVRPILSSRLADANVWFTGRTGRLIPRLRKNREASTCNLI